VCRAPEGNCTKHGQKVDDPLATVPEGVKRAIPIVAEQVFDYIVKCLAQVSSVRAVSQA
jgi:hypothetical protein